MNIKFQESIDEMLTNCSSEQELINLKSELSNYLGSKISDKITGLRLKKIEKENLFHFLNKMSDDEFESYLKNKYGKDSNGVENLTWHFSVSLTEEEFERYGVISKRRIKELMEELAARTPHFTYQKAKWF